MLQKVRCFILFVSLFIILFTSFSKISAQSQKELLNQAFEKKSDKPLIQFFENWRDGLDPLNDEEYKNLSDVEKDVYDIFYDFYTPKNLKRLELENQEYYYNKNVRYYVIYPNIYYEVLNVDNYDSILRMKFEYPYIDDSTFHFNFRLGINKSDKFSVTYEMMWVYLFNNYSKRDSITNFSPRLQDKDVGLLYYSKTYDSLISNFIGNYKIPYGMFNVDITVELDSLINSRMKYLKPYIFTMRSHGGEHILIITNPDIYGIYFSKDRCEAIIAYSTAYHSNTTYYIKKDGVWTFVKDKMHMIW